MLVAFALYALFVIQFASLQGIFAARLMVLYFLTWYFRGPPAAGREGRKEKSGDTPAPPAMGLRPPAPPALLFRAAGRKEGGRCRGVWGSLSS